MEYEITIETEHEQEVVDITREVKNIIKKSKVKNGICFLFVKHATAGIIINESCDPKVGEDFLDALNRMIPLHASWRHDQVDNNAAAHIKAAIIGPSELVPVEDRELKLGTWQQIALVDFDGPKKRRVFVKIL